MAGGERRTVQCGIARLSRTSPTDLKEEKHDVSSAVKDMEARLGLREGFGFRK